MSALHRQWLTDQAAPRRPSAPLDTADCDTRRFARTTDEAFRTPAWRNPVQGPYRRASGLGHLLRAALTWALVLGVGLLLVGAML